MGAYENPKLFFADPTAFGKALEKPIIDYLDSQIRLDNEIDNSIVKAQDLEGFQNLNLDLQRSALSELENTKKELKGLSKAERQFKINEIVGNYATRQQAVQAVTNTMGTIDPIYLNKKLANGEISKEQYDLYMSTKPQDVKRLINEKGEIGITYKSSLDGKEKFIPAGELSILDNALTKQQVAKGLQNKNDKFEELLNSGTYTSVPSFEEAANRSANAIINDMDESEKLQVITEFRSKYPDEVREGATANEIIKDSFIKKAKGTEAYIKTFTNKEKYERETQEEVDKEKRQSQIRIQEAEQKKQLELKYQKPTEKEKSIQLSIDKYIENPITQDEYNNVIQPSVQYMMKTGEGSNKESEKRLVDLMNSKGFTFKQPTSDSAEEKYTGARFVDNATKKEVFIYFEDDFETVKSKIRQAKNINGLP